MPLGQVSVEWRPQASQRTYRHLFWSVRSSSPPPQQSEKAENCRTYNFRRVDQKIDRLHVHTNEVLHGTPSIGIPHVPCDQSER